MTALPYPEKIHYLSDASIKDNVTIVMFGDGYQQRMENGINAQSEEWSIIYPALSTAEFQTAMTAFKSAGAVFPLTWTSPLDGVVKKYVAVPGSRKVTKIADKWRLTLSLLQVFEP